MNHSDGALIDDTDYYSPISVKVLVRAYKYINLAGTISYPRTNNTKQSSGNFCIDSSSSQFLVHLKGTNQTGNDKIDYYLLVFDRQENILDTLTLGTTWDEQTSFLVDFYRSLDREYRLKDYTNEEIYFELIAGLSEEETIVDANT